MTINICVFGGSGGLASQLFKKFEKNKYKIKLLSSKDCDVRNGKDCTEQVKNQDIVFYFSVVNYDNLIAKYSCMEIDHMIDVNVKGYINVLQSCAVNFKEQNHGKVIFVSSVLARSPLKGTSVYSSCKAFCENMTKVFALENTKYNVQANVLRLGYFEAGLLYKVPPDILEVVKNQIPLKRFGSIDDLYKITDFIINDNYATGQTFELTGGL